MNTRSSSVSWIKRITISLLSQTLWGTLCVQLWLQSAGLVAYSQNVFEENRHPIGSNVALLSAHIDFAILGGGVFLVFGVGLFLVHSILASPLSPLSPSHHSNLYKIHCRQPLSTYSMSKMSSLAEEKPFTLLWRSARCFTYIHLFVGFICRYSLPNTPSKQASKQATHQLTN